MVLGVIKQGTVKTFDHLKILPSGKDTCQINSNA